MENIGNSNKTYRIRTNIDISKDSKLDVQLTQQFDILEILSLKIKPSNLYQLQQSNYGVVVGRVVANGGFGVPNAKVSIFIPAKDNITMDEFLQYSYTSPNDMHNGIKFNILADEVDTTCHQDVGTLPTKTYMLDNNVIMQIFKDYYKLTTSTNEAGDYMLFGVPTGEQQLHMDVDLSDIGLLSQTPRDMIYKGYNLNLFDSPTKFKASTDLDSLPQLQSQNKSIYVYPYWGETNELKDNIAITRCDIKLAYEFEPTCVFIGSAVGDSASNAIGKKCVATDDCGKMSELVASEGSIEMIRYNINGNIEEYPIMGNRLMDGDGTWCYQIPMNLDYVTTDEFGNTVPTDDPTKGIPTRAKVRFRITMDETGEEGIGRKKARYLIPHNPATTKDVDYKFGSETKESSFIDLLWNKVYSVKNYIPRLEKSRKQGRKRIAKTREHTGIKAVNHNNGKNPIPYNNITMKLNFGYRFRCVMLKVILGILNVINTNSWFLNTTLITVLVAPIIAVLTVIKGIIKGLTFGKGGSRIQNAIDKIKYNAQIPYAALDAEFCMIDDDKPVIYIPIAVNAGNIISRYKAQKHGSYQEAIQEYDSVGVKTIQVSNFNESELAICVETQLAEENEVVFYNFYNDWLNGCLYFPLWFRKLKRPRKLFFGLIRTKGIDRWCSDDKRYKILQRETCDEKTARTKGKPNKKLEKVKDFKAYSTRFTTNIAYGGNSNNGLIHVEKNMLDELVYYYNANWFKTDIILLGSMDSYDKNGIPQFFKYLPITTYQKPNAIRLTDPDDDSIIEMSGENWALDRKAPDYYSSGLFYQLACSDSRTLMLNKTCFNVKRVCELGVDLDLRYQLENGSYVNTDGLITTDEIVSNDIRAMFATMNDYNTTLPRLSVIRNNESSMMEYQFLYSYGKEFDGINWGESKSSNQSYTNFRGGSNDIDVTQRKNSFYFYFGLNEGKTAIEKFNSQFYADCGVHMITEECFAETEVADWCDNDKEKNKIILNLSRNLDYPIRVMVSNEDGEIIFERDVKEKELSQKTNSNNYVYTITSSESDTNLSYGKYIVSITNSENIAIYDNIVSLYPDFIDVTATAMPFNVISTKLASIISSSKNDASKINYSNGNIVYGTEPEIGVYQQGTTFEGRASRKVTVNGRKVELGGIIALRLGEGYLGSDCEVSITGTFNINGTDYTYTKSYTKSNINSIIRKYETTFNDESTIYDILCLCVPYYGTYNITVRHICSGSLNNDTLNVWSGDVFVKEYVEPVVTFSDNDGNSMTIAEIKDFISILGGETEVWSNMIDKGGILDIMVNENNTYYQKLLSIYNQGNGDNYQKLNKLVELNSKLIIEDSMTDKEKQEIESENNVIEENNKEQLKQLLIHFYQIFTRTQEQDGLNISSNNETTEVNVTAPYRTIVYGENKTECNDLNEKISNTKFNEHYSDYSTNEAILFDNAFNKKIITYDKDKGNVKYICDVSDPLGSGSITLQFNLFDKRMEVFVLAVGNLYKYSDDDENNVEKTYVGNLSVKVKNGFKGYSITNLYENWGYEWNGEFYELYPTNTKGEPINTDLKVDYISYSPATRSLRTNRTFNLEDEDGVTNIIVQDGIGNTLQVSDIRTSGECALGIGGILLVSDDFAGKGNMKEDYGSYTYTGSYFQWTDTTVSFSDNKVTLTGGLTGDRDKQIGKISLGYATSVASDSVSIKGIFRNWVTTPITDKGMAIEFDVNNYDQITQRATSHILNVYLCDNYKFECTNGTYGMFLHASSDNGGGYGNRASFKDENGNFSLNFPYIYHRAGSKEKVLDVDFGLYFTWSVKNSYVDGDHYGDWYDVISEIKGFYLQESDPSSNRLHLDKYDEGSEMEKTGNTSTTNGMYLYLYNSESNEKVHWMQVIFALGSILHNGLNLDGSGVSLCPSNWEYGVGETTNDGCKISGSDKQQAGAFIWTGYYSGGDAFGYPITYRYNKWAHYGYDSSWKGGKNITGVVLTSGPTVTRHFVCGAEGVDNYRLHEGGFSY